MVTGADQVIDPPLFISHSLFPSLSTDWCKCGFCFDSSLSITFLRSAKQQQQQVLEDFAAKMATVALKRFPCFPFGRHRNLLFVLISPSHYLSTSQRRSFSLIWLELGLQRYSIGLRRMGRDVENSALSSPRVYPVRRAPQCPPLREWCRGRLYCTLPPF